MKTYVPSQQETEKLDNNFQYHKPVNEDQAKKYEMIRHNAKLVGFNLLEMCPPSRELSLALTKLEESVFWANAAIARNEKTA